MTPPGPPHIAPTRDLRRVMNLVLVALLPCALMAMWNTGHEANLALAGAGVAGWRGAILGGLGGGTDPSSLYDSVLHGALRFLPCVLVSGLGALFWERLFAFARRRPVVPGARVTALLFPLTLPPTVPLWQVLVGISFGIVFARELFGGTGRNFVNPALAARAFVYFSYPASHAGDAVWVAVDGYTCATPLTAVSMSDAAVGMKAVTLAWGDAFLGAMPGSMGETSKLACLLGAAFLLATRIASWRVMLSMLLGGASTAAIFHAMGSATNPMFSMPAHWHLVTGGFAFGLVFMATDPVTSAQTDAGRWVYGFLVGFFCIVIRVLNPGFSESVMIVILLGNVFAPLIDWFVAAANIRRRRANASS